MADDPEQNLDSENDDSSDSATDDSAQDDSNDDTNDSASQQGADSDPEVGSDEPTYDAEASGSAAEDQPSNESADQNQTGSDPAAASALDAATQDADANLDNQPADAIATPCGAEESGGVKPAPGVNPPPPPVPGNLNVLVLNDATGQPITGAAVAISGPASFNEATDGSGMVKKNGIPTGDYTATASSNGFTTENGSATVAPAATATITIKLTPITVTIALAQPVACPGHPLAITATGNPGGGTFAWTIAAPAADLVDSGGTAVRTGATVNLLGFQADTSTGNIPAQSAAIAVTYTVRGGQASTNQNVSIHEIKFVTTNNAINQSPTTVVESAAMLKVAFGIAATMSTDPQVEIHLDASCPRKTDCASNHRVGWLQTVLTFVSDQRYTHTLIHKTPAMPVRDNADPAAPVPFYLSPTAFTADGNKQTAHHEDSPGTQAAWTDPRAASPAPPPAQNKQLRQVTRTESFTAWLVVQNIEWSAHDMPGSFAFVGNFDWAMGITVTVDTTQAVGSRGTPQTANPTVPATISTGKGGGTPNLAAPVANTTTNDPAVLHIDPAPAI